MLVHMLFISNLPVNSSANHILHNSNFDFQDFSELRENPGLSRRPGNPI